MLEEIEEEARRDALRLLKEYGEDASLYAALKAQKAIGQRDYGRCARWKRVLDILAEHPGFHH